MLAPEHHVTRIAPPPVPASLVDYKPVVKFVDHITIAEILALTCRALEIDVNLVNSDSRKHLLSDVRQVYIYYSRMLTNSTWSDIGRLVERSHSDAIRLFNRVKDLVDVSDEIIVTKVNKVEKAIKKHLDEKI